MQADLPADRGRRLKGWFERVLDYVSRADDAFENRYTESGQGVMRIVILSGLLLTYLATYSSLLSDDGEINRLFVLAIFSALALALFTLWHIRTRPHNHLRKVFTTAIDSGYIGLGLYYSPESAGILLPIYLWLSIGNGFRYGVGHLVYTSVCNLLFFTIALLVMDQARFALIDGKYLIGIYVAMIITPAYTLVLFKRLSKSLKEERKVSQFKSRFLANMSHELRTPINAILNANVLLVNARHERDKKRYSNLISASSKTLLDLIDQVLDLNKIEANSTVLKHEPVVLYELLIEIADSVRANTVLKGISFKEAYSPELPLTINTDSTRIKQILINLLNNATKFTQRGGIIFRACLRERMQQPWLRFRVEDTGPGVARENELKIFQPFFQEESTFDSSLGGAGIGLAISQSFANLLGGHISYQRVNGKTVFECWLPFEEASPPANEAPPPAGIRFARMMLGDDPIWNQLKAFVRAEAEAPALVDYPAGDPAGQQAAEQSALFPLVLSRDYFGRGVELVARFRPDVTQTAFVLATDDIDLDPCMPDDFPFDRTVLIRCATVHGGVSLEGLIKAGSVARLLYRRHMEFEELQSEQSRPRYEGRVLVIDDNDINRTTISAVLNHYGVSTRSAADGAEGLRMLEQAAETDDGGAFDLVICDLQMPGMSGYEFVDRYAERTAASDRIPICILTADIRKETHDDLKRRGVHRFLTKPIDPKALLRGIGDLLRVAHPGAASAPARGAEAKPASAQVAATGIPFTLIDDMADNGMPPERVKELVSLLEEHAEQSFQDIYRAYDQGDGDALTFLLHRLTGSLSALGAVELSDICRRMLDTARDDGLDRLDRDDISRLEVEIRDFVAGSHARLDACLQTA